MVLGGPHVTLVPDDAAPHADAIVVGYAEDTWPELLRDLAAGRLRPRYDQDPALSLAGRPLPDRSVLPHDDYLTTNVFEATRSCGTTVVSVRVATLAPFTSVSAARRRTASGWG